MTDLPVAHLAVALALAWGAGLRLYLVLFLCGLAGRMQWVLLPGELQILGETPARPWLPRRWETVLRFR